MPTPGEHKTVQTPLHELMEVYTECSEPNWDGYNAFPVTEGTAQQARRVLESLPLEIPAPAFCAEPHGLITMEWYYSPRRSLSVGVDDEAKLYYAALIGEESAHDTVPFSGQFPVVLVELIRRVLPRAEETS